MSGNRFYPTVTPVTPVGLLSDSDKTPVGQPVSDKMASDKKIKMEWVVVAALISICVLLLIVVLVGYVDDEHYDGEREVGGIYDAYDRACEEVATKNKWSRKAGTSFEEAGILKTGGGLTDMATGEGASDVMHDLGFFRRCRLKNTPKHMKGPLPDDYKYGDEEGDNINGIPLLGDIPDSAWYTSILPFGGGEIDITETRKKYTELAVAFRKGYLAAQSLLPPGIDTRDNTFLQS